MDDNTNFQTLAFAVDIDNAYTIIGRFNGKYLPNDMYQIDSLEFVAYNLFSKKRNTYKVKDVSVENNENIVTFKVFLDSNAGSASASKDVDYTYKTNNDAPIIVNRSTVLSFDVEDIDGNKSLPGGGYECRGLPSYRGRSR
jgi:purine nucleoside permease